MTPSTLVMFLSEPDDRKKRYVPDNIVPLPVWEKKPFADLITDARHLNGLSMRAAGEITGLNFPRFIQHELATRRSTHATNKKFAKLGLDVDLLDLRQGYLPAGAGVDFQDEVYRLWQKRKGRASA